MNYHSYQVFCYSTLSQVFNNCLVIFYYRCPYPGHLRYHSYHLPYILRLRWYLFEYNCRLLDAVR